MRRAGFFAREPGQSHEQGFRASGGWGSAQDFEEELLVSCGGQVDDAGDDGFRQTPE
ncbi:MAG: hypothetical protein HY905_02630 [Deltaproteobacteria bacterium]|nr:hypothetical protein [Deltaproteobacteria bacterium]